jgi:predicted RNA-binding Zn-ribbon protein involved in translation (DUF1610 family)
MPDLLSRCTGCQSLLDEEDLFCANCGREAPRPAGSDDAVDSSRVATHNFTCSGCGASMSYDARASALRCPFCGSVDMVEQKDARVLRPRGVVPFQVTQEQAERSMREWLGQGFWRPGDLSQTAAVTAMRPVYVPYWIFEARTHTYWTADTSQTPPGARADWYPMAGEHRGRYSELLIGASAALSAWETADLRPFDLSAAVPPEQVDLDNITVEQFSMPRKYARPLAEQALAERESEACRQRYVPGSARNVHVNVLVEGMTSVPILLPVWIMAYRYRDQVFRFLVNGQTGRATGQAPTSWTKVGVAVAIALGVALLLAAVAALAR